MRGAPGGGRAPTHAMPGRKGPTEAKNWIEDCYWPRPSPGDKETLTPRDLQPASESNRSQNNAPEPVGLSNGHVSSVSTCQTRDTTAPRVRSLRPGNHIRVLALNNQFSLWQQSSNSNMDDFEDSRIEEVEEESSENISPPATKLILPKFKSKLPFSPKSYRKNYSNWKWLLVSVSKVIDLQ